MYTKFSEYETQKDTNNIFDNQTWRVIKTQNGIVINPSNLQLLLTKIDELNISDYDYVKNELKITETQLKEVSHVLNLTLNSVVEKSDMGSYDLIKGNYVSLRKIISDNYLKRDCNYSVTKQIKTIAIFALNTIFIDEDIICPESQITFIAPKWEIIGNRTIDLSGFNAHHYKHGNTTKDVIQNHDKNGKPGYPGGPGGFFFGIGEEFVNGQSLRIVANGGKGGTGEDGYPGKTGDNGDPAVIDPAHLYSCTKDMCLKNISNMFQCDVLYEQHVSLKIRGEPGHQGEKGGDGGQGGKGGKPGLIALFELNGNSIISKQNIFGDNGKAGAGGKGGFGGKHGDNLDLKCNVYSHSYPLETTLEKNSSQALQGPSGSIGGNEQDIEEPRDTKKIDDPSEILSEYKAYLRENLINHFGSSTLIRFLKHLEENKDINSMYKLLGLFDEQVRLENQFYELDIGVGYIPFFKSLLNRIEEYSNTVQEKIKDKTVLDQYKKSLAYLYTAVAQRIHGLKENFDSFLITNIENYLLSLKKDVDDLKNYQAEKNKADIVDQLQKNYKTGVDEKIKEAKNLIDNQITGQIKNISREFDSNIQELVDEVSSMIREQEANSEMLNTSLLKLQNKIKSKTLFNIVEFISSSLAILFPQAAGVCGVIGKINGVVESLVIGDEEDADSFKLSQLSAKINTDMDLGKNLISAVMNERVGRFNTFLAYVEERANENKAKFGNMTKKMQIIKYQLNKIDGSDYNIVKIQALEKEFNQELQKSYKVCLQVNSDDAENETTTDKYVEGLEKAYELGQGVMELINKYKDDDVKLKIITDAIENSAEEIQRLKNFKRNVYNILSVMIRKIVGEMSKVENGLGTKSKVSLDVTKWEVQKSLKYLKWQIKNLIKGYEVVKSFGQSIENLDEAMVLLITVYDHIQNYQEHLNFANYLTEVSSVQASSISITDPKVLKAINRLEIAIRSNLIVEQYELSKDAFKQFVFPFAHLYSSQMKLPKSLNLTSNVNNLAEKVVDRIDFMIKNLEMRKNLLTFDENSIGHGEFSSRGESTQPLFVWKNDENKERISDLLSGKEILVKADIEQSDLLEDAIKFKVLGLDFKARDGKKQSELNELLKAFRIKMINVGNSYYRCDREIYVMSTKKYGFWYNFETNTDGMPKHASKLYEDIRRGPYMLSPYAMWKISLINLPNKRNITFQSLETYKDKVDLELTGHASYIIKDDDTSCSKLELDKYYQTVDKYELGSNNNYTSIFDKKALINKILEIYEEPELARTRVILSDGVDSWFTWKQPNFTSNYTMN